MRAAAGAGGLPSSQAEPFPWQAVMAVGLGLLRLSPKDFWTMTPIEFAYAAGMVRAGDARLSRADLDALTRRFPDGG